jgi:hypothetical protein
VRRSADPALTFAVSVVLTLVCSYSTIIRAARGALDVSDGAARIVVLLAVSWFLVHVVATLIVLLRSPTPASPPPRPRVVRRVVPPADTDRRQIDAA